MIRYKIHSKVLIGLFLIAFLLVGFLHAQEGTLLPESLLKEIIHEVSGEKAWWHVNRLAQFHRIDKSMEYHEAAVYVEEQARVCGLEDVEIETYAADGKTWNFTHRTSPAWDAEMGVLWMVEPYKKKLADYDEIRVSLAMGSNSTDVTAELVDVGVGEKAEDYQGLDVKGKLVLASGSPGSVQEQAVFERGALGVLSYYTISWQNTRQPGDFPDQVTWSSISPQSDEGQEGGFGFMLSYRTGMMLRQLIFQGQSVVLRAEIKASVHPGHYGVVTGKIPGTRYPDQEFVFIAHLDHYRPGANDNASGSAVLLEIARTFQRLVAKGIIAPPIRSIRFLWVPEISGTIPYLAAHPEVFDRTFGVVNMDMVGADHKKTQASFHLTRTPHSLPTYFDDVIQHFTEYARDNNRERFGGDRTLTIIAPTGSRNTFDVGIEEYGGGSDHYIFTDGAIGIPAVMFGTWPDVYYHTNEDTPEKVDPTTLKRAAFLGVAPALYLTRLTSESVPRLAMETHTKGKARLARDERKANSVLANAKPEKITRHFREAKNIIHQAYAREAEAVLSCSFLAGEEKNVLDYLKKIKSSLQNEENAAQKRLDDYYGYLCKDKGVEPARPTVTEEERRLQDAIPERVMAYRGPLGREFLKEKLGEDFDEGQLLIQKEIPSGMPSAGNIPYETLNFVDGKRSITEIRNAVSAEYVPVSLNAVEEYMRVLEKAGVVSMKK